MMSEEELREISVGREKLLKRITDELGQAAKGKFRNHYLFIGPRGIGKTHFLLLLYYTIKGGKLNKKYIPVKFAEKEPSITNMYSFTIRILERLSQEGLDQSANIQTVRKMGPREGLEYALGTLYELRKKTRKQIILLLENLHRIFKALGRTDKAKLRSLLQEDDTFIVIGTAPIYLKEVSNAGDPMYLFFKQETLTGLSDEEAIAFLENLDRKSGCERIHIDRDGDRIRGLNRLTGGFPRLLIWLYEIFSTSRVVDVEKNIFQLLDDLSSYYDLRMEGIPPQQEALVDALAQFDGPARPKELSELTGMSVRTVSSQLKRLSKSGYIKKVFPEKRKKAAIYEISDSLFRLWRDMREPLGREKVTLIIRFFKLWYSTEEMIEEFGKLETKAYEAYDSGSIDEARECLRCLSYFQETATGGEMIRLHERLFQAYEKTGLTEEAEKEAERLMSRGKFEGRKDKQLAAFIDHLKLTLKKGDTKKLEKYSAEFMDFDSGDAKLWSVKASIFDRLGMYGYALECHENRTGLMPSDPGAWLDAGNYSYNKGRFNKCLIQFETALVLYEELLGREPDIIRHKQNLAGISHNLGAVFYYMGRREKALQKYNIALEMREELLKIDPDDVVYRLDLALTSNNLGTLLSDLGRREEALQKYNKALEMGEKLLRDEPDNVVYRSYVATIRNNVGNLLRDIERREEALQKYNKALEMYEKLLKVDPDNVVLKSYVAISSNNLGILLSDIESKKEALQKYNKALEIREELLKIDSDNIVYRSSVATTSNNLGALLSDMGQREEALQKYNKALVTREELLRTDPENVVYRSNVAMTNNNLGILFRDMNQEIEAGEYYEKALTYASALPDKGVKLWIGRSWLFMKTEKYDEAIADGEKALETAKELGWKAELYKAVSNLILIHLTISEEYFKDKDIKKARTHFLEALKTSKRVETADMERDVVGYLKAIAPSGEYEFIGEILEGITEELGKEYDDLLKPYIKALEYARTGDPDVLLVLHQEQREVAREIAELMTGGDNGKDGIEEN